MFTLPVLGIYGFCLNEAVHKDAKVALLLQAGLNCGHVLYMYSHIKWRIACKNMYKVEVGVMQEILQASDVNVAIVGQHYPRISVVVPARNEAQNLVHVLPHIPSSVDEVILIDGRSPDDTIAVAQQLMPTIKVIKQTRKGKGDALRLGF